MHLLRKAIPRELIAPIPYIDPSDRPGKHTTSIATWRKNPKSRTAQEHVREKKRAEAAAKDKKGKVRGRKRSADEAFEGDTVREPKGKGEMVLISELGALPPFLAGVDDGMIAAEAAGFGL